MPGLLENGHLGGGEGGEEEQLTRRLCSFHKIFPTLILFASVQAPPALVGDKQKGSSLLLRTHHLRSEAGASELAAGGVYTQVKGASVEAGLLRRAAAFYAVSSPVAAEEVATAGVGAAAAGGSSGPPAVVGALCPAPELGGQAILRDHAYTGAHFSEQFGGQ